VPTCRGLEHGGRLREPGRGQGNSQCGLSVATASVVSAFVEAVVVLLPSRAQGCSGSLAPTLAALVTCCSEMRADGRARGSEAMYEGDTVNGSVTWARRPCVSSCPCCPPGILNHNSQWWRKQDNLQNLSCKAQCTQAPSLFD